ncbi:MAG: carboxypeptidase regulatory-like domain-containing protein [Nocardioides sp.]
MEIISRRPWVALLAVLMLLATAPAFLGAARADTARPEAARRDGFFSGKVVDQRTGNPVKGVTVKVFRINTDDLLGQDKTGSAGKFRIDGIPNADEELDVRVNGSAVHYESGWVGCAHKVVPSWGAACSFGQGHQTPFFIQHL